MNKKILALSVLGLSLFGSILNSFGEDSTQLEIIPRASWGANSLYNDINSKYWTTILESRRNYVNPKSQEIIGEQKIKTEKINSYLNDNFSDQFTYQEKVEYNEKTNTEYAWDLKYTQYVDSIIVHHTTGEYDNDLTGLQQIHKYHSLSNQWGDIGYNYIIGYNGDIYEGREGGDYVVGAHSSYNNNGSVGIAVLGDYDSKPINNKQYETLEKLIQHLTVKYGIDLSKKRYYHMNCSWIKCDTFPLETYLDSVLSGHRDATHTTCPGEELYKQMQQIRADNLDFTAGFKPIARGSNHQKPQQNETNLETSKIQQYRTLLKKYTPQQQQNIFEAINKKLEQDLDPKTKESLQILRLAIILNLED